MIVRNVESVEICVVCALKDINQHICLFASCFMVTRHQRQMEVTFGEPNHIFQEQGETSSAVSQYSMHILLASN